MQGTGKNKEAKAVMNVKQQTILQKRKQVIENAIEEQSIELPYVRYVKLNEIIAPDVEMRDKIDGSELNSLAESIKKVGLINPITLRKKNSDYEIIAGIRRFHAHKILMRDEILSYVMESDERDTIIRRYAENIERTDITPWEEAKFLMHLQKKFNLNQTELAKTIGKSVAYVNERIQIPKYPTELYNALVYGQIDYSVARELNRIDNLDKMLEALEWAIRTGANARTAKIYREDINQAMKLTPDEQKLQGEQIQYPDYKPEVVYVSCALCQEKIDLNKSFIIRACRDCYHKTIS
jgi:ParB family chromosome partitioning protein